ncbi:nucleotidyltransferase family protein [Pseudohalioglobus sediminis]|uniref:Nucleotidyltransferase family protein n=1 Tax=Pseudohalioglobus sediminis TaxID=2606449 RepID=A0A5B0WPR9_9GAMM|nr:nucleotidyltransferase family protein [Pseudohalioglobus sediminis]KAA1188933.1 nucleotidyltransferase family protein [Pseudohalioglobus sediminis]
MARNEDRHAFHRAALKPFVPGTPTPRVEELVAGLGPGAQTPFTDFLLQQGMGPLWDKLLETQQAGEVFSTEDRQRLHHSRLQATGDYLLQHHNLKAVRSALDAAGVEHITFKGCHTREAYYPEPALRPAVDLDILVPPEEKLKAIRTLQGEGYHFHGKPENISHECDLVKGKIAIDLHWDILRPGRTRVPMADELINDKVDYRSHWGPSPAGTLLLILVHPVFNKYCNGPRSSLVRLVDTLQLLERYPNCLEEAIQLLHRAGLVTAGWITANWLQQLTGHEQADHMAALLQPGYVRRHYLEWWLRTDLSSRWQESAAIIHLGFTLPAHDNLQDALRATQTAREARKHGKATLKALEQALEAGYHKQQHTIAGQNP